MSVRGDRLTKVAELRSASARWRGSDAGGAELVKRLSAAVVIIALVAGICLRVVGLDQRPARTFPGRSLRGLRCVQHSSHRARPSRQFYAARDAGFRRLPHASVPVLAGAAGGGIRTQAGRGAIGGRALGQRRPGRAHRSGRADDGMAGRRSGGAVRRALTVAPDLQPPRPGVHHGQRHDHAGVALFLSMAPAAQGFVADAERRVLRTLALFLRDHQGVSPAAARVADSAVQE